jgi:hypothetical protein
MKRRDRLLMFLTARGLPTAGLLAAGLVLVARPSLAAPPAPTLIVPGQSLGTLRLGTGVGALYQTPGFGQPDRTHATGSITYLTYGRQGVTVAVRENTVVLILTTSERFRTDKGVAVGQPASAALAHGAASRGGDPSILWFDDAGLVVVTGGGIIARIGVYDPGQFVRAILADERPARDVFLTARAPKVAEATTAGAGARAATVVVTLKNAGRGSKVLNPNYLVLVDRDGQRYRYDRSTFAQGDACRSTVLVRPGETKSCSVVFVLPAGRTPRSIVFDDGASADEHYF